MESAVMAAFVSGTDEEFDELLELCGAAAADDMREGAPCVNVAHAQTGPRGRCWRGWVWCAGGSSAALVRLGLPANQFGTCSYSAHHIPTPNFQTELLIAKKQ